MSKQESVCGLSDTEFVLQVAFPNTTPASNASRAAACIEMLSLYVRLKIGSSQIFRTLVDDWFAFSRGFPFLNSKGKPVWLNNPDPARREAALLGMHYISEKARRCIKGRERCLVKDHAIPLQKLEQMLKHEWRDWSPAGVRAFLERYYRLGVITQEEHTQLSQRGFRSSMPPDWDKLDPWARYKAVKIEGVAI